MVDTKTEIKQWLEKALVKENLKDISVDILGNSEKGDGYMGDIVFVNAKGTNIINNEEKNLNLVLKCSKKSQSLRDSVPVKEAFYNEIFIYGTVLPEYQKFQRSKSIQNVFDSFAKYYGHFTNETTEIIVLENLKKIGYELWDIHKPLSKNHILMVVEKYGELHGISAAYQVQNPKKFKEFGEQLDDVMRLFAEQTNVEKMMVTAISYAHDLLEGSCDEHVLQTFSEFKSQLNYIFNDMGVGETDDFKVISHGDCWNNNFMWQHCKDNKTVPEKVALLDWQLSSLASPILDLSYFLFSCISPEDLNNLNTILDTYYKSFTKTVKQLGNNGEDLYPKTQFLNDWQKFARFGVALCMVLIKMGYCDRDNLPDMEKSADEGKDFGDTFTFDITDKEGFISRIKPIVEYAVKNHLVD